MSPRCESHTTTAPASRNGSQPQERATLICSDSCLARWRAAQTDTTARQSLVDSATKLDQRASDLFDRGYQKILAIENALGIVAQSPANISAPGA